MLLLLLLAGCVLREAGQMEPMSLRDIWIAFQTVHLPPHRRILPAIEQCLRADNPFLLNYVFYHHYRSLGWVVRSGIKFCVDYLLYKRGPVFHHAECVRLLLSGECVD